MKNVGWDRRDCLKRKATTNGVNRFRERTVGTRVDYKINKSRVYRVQTAKDKGRKVEKT